MRSFQKKISECSSINDFLILVSNFWCTFQNGRENVYWCEFLLFSYKSPFLSHTRQNGIYKMFSVNFSHTNSLTKFDDPQKSSIRHFGATTISLFWKTRKSIAQLVARSSSPDFRNEIKKTDKTKLEKRVSMLRGML